jgi:hypothetical protein
MALPLPELYIKKIALPVLLARDFVNCYGYSLLLRMNTNTSAEVT